MSQTRVYKYGLLPPTMAREVVAEQIHLAHRYQNRLIEIERERRESARSILLAHDAVTPAAAEVADIEARIEAALADVAAQRKLTRSRSETCEQRKRIADLRPLLRAARERLKAAKWSLREDVAIQDALRASDERALAASKDARATCGVYWGTYLLAEAAVDAARKSKTDPSFQRWDGSGAVAVQIQHGVTWAEATSCEDTRIQVQLHASPCGAGKERPRVRIRVGSEGRAPVWAEWPLILHRLPPDDAIIMWARVVRERVEAHDRWSLHLTLRLPDEWRTGVSGRGAVAVDLGWRLRPDGLRVAYIRDEAGEHREVLLDPAVLAGLRQVDDLRSIRDQRLDVIRPALAQWLRERACPPWIVEATTTLHQWRSPARFASLSQRWRDQRWDGDMEGFDMLEAWRKKDKHLWTWEVNLRDKVLRRRREQYRVLGAELARCYGVLVVEELDLRELQRHQAPESEDGEIQPARAQQRLASPSELRLCLIGAMTARRGAVVEIDPANTTRACHGCGLTETWDQATYLTHVCGGCGLAWDQDDNACRNLLARARERLAATPDTGCARTDGEPTPRESRWSRLKREKAERSQRGAQGAEIAGLQG